MAVDELLTKGEPVTIKALTLITGYTYHSLYQSQYCDQYKPSSRLKAEPLNKHNRTATTLPHSVEAYQNYLRDCHFLKPQHPSQVLQEMNAEVMHFQPNLLFTAINLMKLKGELQELNDGNLVSTAQDSNQAALASNKARRVAPDEEPYIVLWGETVKHVRGLKAAKEEGRKLLLSNDLKGEVTIAKPVQRIVAELKTFTT